MKPQMIRRIISSDYKAKVSQSANGPSPQAVFELRPIASLPTAKPPALADEAQILRQSP